MLDRQVVPCATFATTILNTNIELHECLEVDCRNDTRLRATCASGAAKAVVVRRAVC